MSIMALREDVGHDDASPPLSTLLYFVQLLVDQHRHEHQQKYPRPDAKRPHRDGKPVDLGQQFRLLLVHVRTRVIQKQLVIPVHGECALVDEEDDQTNCENSEDHRHDIQRHRPPRPNFNPSASGSPALTEMIIAVYCDKPDRRGDYTHPMKEDERYGDVTPPSASCSGFRRT